LFSEAGNLLSLLAFFSFGGGKAAAETKKELRHTAQSGPLTF